MASEFQRRKVAAVFGAMDADGNGYLEESDFETLTARWVGLRGWAPGTDEHERMRSIMMGWWSAIATLSGAEYDDQVSLDELMTVVDQLPAMDDAIYATADAMFDAIDQDKDDRISLTEHKQVVYAWKGSGDGIEDVFPQLDVNGDGHLSRSEFRDLWSGFWRGDDPESPSQWIFGRY
ncbi:EF-hand domain-containing protein [Kribbella sp. NPDC005582]|uniref:EF-hand domain-containing protein n=1 Tax=Kribbella sp. NPDC005582 TaxID=3156893 RepID=UPI0033A59ABB